MSTYFPRFDELKIKKSMMGKILLVEWNSKPIDAIKFERWIQRVRSNLMGYLEL